MAQAAQRLAGGGRFIAFSSSGRTSTCGPQKTPSDVKRRPFPADNRDAIRQEPALTTLRPSCSISQNPLNETESGRHTRTVLLSSLKLALPKRYRGELF